MVQTTSCTPSFPAVSPARGEGRRRRVVSAAGRRLVAMVAASIPREGSVGLLWLLVPLVVAIGCSLAFALAVVGAQLVALLLVLLCLANLGPERDDARQISSLFGTQHAAVHTERMSMRLDEAEGVAPLARGRQCNRRLCIPPVQTAVTCS